MSAIPHDPAPDSTLALLREGYDFIPARCRRFGADLFQSRLLLRKVVCMTGPEATEVFYADGRFTRRGATPRSALRLLQDEGSVQGLDGDAHRRRKALFMALLTPGRVAALCDAFTLQWQARMLSWTWREEEVCLLRETQNILCAAACDWMNIPLRDMELDAFTEALVSMIFEAGTVGPRNWMARRRRAQLERRLAALVENVREGRFAPPEGTALHAMSFYEDASGARLKPRVAAVELLNLLRPIVAVSNYIVFAALALYRFPGWRDRLARADEETLEHFAQEVRRFYPFFPFVGGRVAEPFAWHGHDFANGDWVLLDLYGTNHDPRVWGDPEEFSPDRFREWGGGKFDFVPQGGGDPNTGHRCPGDPVAVALVMAAVRALTRAMTYDVPEQDLTVDNGDIPAIPRSGFVLRDVKLVAPACARRARRA